MFQKLQPRIMKMKGANYNENVNTSEVDMLKFFTVPKIEYIAMAKLLIKPKHKTHLK